MVYLKCLSHIWWRCVFAVFLVISGTAALSQASFAQYPGSASNASDSGLSASSSSGSATSSRAGSGSSGSVSSSYGDSSEASDQTAKATAFGSGVDEPSYMPQTDWQMRPGTAQRKRALIRQFRLEFAKTVSIETASQRRFQPLTADRYLNQFADEIADGLERPADLKSLGKDLAVMRDAIDDRLDRVITSYTGEKPPRRALFARSRPVAGQTPALFSEIRQLALKHELLQFSEYSLQAMGYYAK